MNYGDHKLTVKDIIKRGTSLDTLIPVATRQALLWIERNYTLQYMRHFASFNIDPASGHPRSIPFPGNDPVNLIGPPKAIPFIRIIKADGSLHPLRKIDPTQMREIPEEIPTAYWLDGWDFIWFNTLPPELYAAEIYYVAYTGFQYIVDASEPWIFKVGEDLLLARTIKQLGPQIRDDDTLRRWDVIEKEALRTLLLAEEELEREGTDDVMQYGVVDDA